MINKTIYGITLSLIFSVFSIGVNSGPAEAAVMKKNDCTGSTVNSGDTYVLTSNVSTSGAACFDIDGKSNITINLNGYTIDCNDSGGSFGVRIKGNSKSITVTNGRIDNCEAGVGVNSSGGVTINRIKATSNINGFDIGNSSAVTISNSIAQDSSSDGISIYQSAGTVIKSTFSENNGSYGVNGDYLNGLTVTSSFLRHNGSDGLYANNVTGLVSINQTYSINNGTSGGNTYNGITIRCVYGNGLVDIQKSEASSNDNDGFNLRYCFQPSKFSLIAGNSAYDNVASGFFTQNLYGATVSTNIAEGNDWGFYLENASTAPTSIQNLNMIVKANSGNYNSTDGFRSTTDDMNFIIATNASNNSAYMNGVLGFNGSGVPNGGTGNVSKNNGPGMNESTCINWTCKK